MAAEAHGGVDEETSAPGVQRVGRFGKQDGNVVVFPGAQKERLSGLRRDSYMTGTGDPKEPACSRARAYLLARQGRVFLEGETERWVSSGGGPEEGIPTEAPGERTCEGQYIPRRL